MQRKLILFGAAFMAVAVILGAMGAHALDEAPSVIVSDDQLNSFETGVRYQVYHAFALLLLAVLYTKLQERLARISVWLFIIGTLLFSGSIYFLAMKNLLGIESLAPVLGPITPLGGICLISGWILIFLAAYKTKST
jgi:uncharacterized membrane protein YgdD (TMEM256/DUF423 family)